MDRFTSFRKKCEYALNEIECTWYEFITLCNKLIKIPVFVIRQILAYLTPIVLGVYVKMIIEELNSGTFAINWQTFSKYYPIIICVVIILLVMLWKNRINNQDCHKKRLEDCIKGIFEDYGLHYERNISDIRCTIWTPINSRKKFKKMHVIQLIDYFPKFLGDEEVARENGENGRIRKISRRINNEIKPKGIIGKCIFESLRDNKPIILMKNIDRDNLQKFLHDSWNYTNSEIRRLTNQRLSYLCLTLMNSSRTDILGVLYFDSSIMNEIDEEFKDDVEYYLPRIANILVQ